jgi:hypothetical protein
VQLFTTRIATYDHKQVLADYAAGRIKPEMAVADAPLPIQ